MTCDLVQRGICRLDDTTWEYTPQGSAFRLRCSMKAEDVVAFGNIITSLPHNIAPNFFDRGWTCFEKSSTGEGSCAWKVTAKKTNIMVQAFQKVKTTFGTIFLKSHVIEPKDVIYVKLEPTKIKGESQAVVLKDNRAVICAPLSLPEKCQHFARSGMDDPFTIMATEHLQFQEVNFVTEKEPRGHFRFHLSEDRLLTIVPITKNDDDKSNVTVVKLFKEFVLEEYGEQTIDRLKYSYNIDFDALIESKAPLLPDHVFKANIAAIDVDMYQVEDGLQWIAEQLKLLSVREFIEFLPTLSKMADPKQRCPLSGRVRRKLCALYNTSKKEISPLLQSIKETGVWDIQQFSSQQIAQCMNIWMPTLEEREKAFTGRKITHVPIQGFKTMGDKKQADPCRDFFELSHIWGQLQTSSWKAYYELVAHVVAKKTLLRVSDPSKEPYCVGTILPAPTDNGMMQYYYVEHVANDLLGMVRYVLLPLGVASHGKPSLPVILLNRSTASASGNMSYAASVLGDLKFSAPGTLHERSAATAKNYMRQRTLPLWSAYVEAATQDGNQEMFSGMLGESIEYFATYLYRRKVHLTKRYPTLQHLAEKEQKESCIQELRSLAERGQWNQVHAALVKYQADFKERPSDKIPANIAILGHSLGGALTQSQMIWYEALDRVPLPGCCIEAFMCDSPAVSRKENERFLDFVKRHNTLFNMMKSQIKLEYTFEEGDIVPASGERHLGACVDSTPLPFSYTATVFHPNDTSKAKAMLGVTHGRRFFEVPEKEGSARNYSAFPATHQDLHEFDTSWWKSKKVSILFGFTCLSAKVVEAVRKVASVLLTPALYVYTYFWGNNPQKTGVFTVRYTPLRYRQTY